MSSQLFKKKIPEYILFNFLDKFCEKKDNYYLLSKTSFKQASYHNYIDELCNILKEYYHTSKLYYIERKLNYSKFVTIIRQLCNINNIVYTTNIVYNNSTYDILYNIYM